MNRITKIIFTISSCLLISCTTPNSYLNKAIDILEENSINKKSIDWIKFRKDVLEEAKDAQKIKETYPAIEFALTKLRDNHSVLVTPDEYKFYKNPKILLPEISSEIINDSIGYLKIPGFNGISASSTQKFARNIQDKIRDLDKNDIQLWIIDLGADTGGNMWPMLLGLGPLLGEGVFGYFVTPENNFKSWGYSNGSVFLNDKPYLNLENPYKLKKSIKKLVVIISNSTASSGEAIAVAFVGSENSLFIGEHSHGLTTCNSTFRLSDGAAICLTTAKFADRNRKVYGVPIKPDLEVSSWTAKKIAADWISKK